MDLCDDASEFTKLELLRIWKQVFVALQEVHKKQVHFDVKPENILLDDKKNAYLADFGLAESLHTSRKTKGHEASGSPGFEAPEVRKGAILPLGHQYVFYFFSISISNRASNGRFKSIAFICNLSINIVNQ